MQKYMISFFLLLAMNGTTMSMQTAMRLYGNQKYFIRLAKHNFNSTYYDACANKSDNRFSTFTISELAIEIKKLEYELQNMKEPVLLDSNDSEAIGAAKVKKIEIFRQKELLQRNKDLLRKYLDDLWKQKKTAHE